MNKLSQIIRPSLFLLILLVLGSCGKGKQKNLTEVELNLEDAVIQQIINLRSKKNAQGRSNTEAIKTYLAVENPSHRYAAALMLGSIQDSAAITALGAALKDPYPEVRWAAAFALGQTRNELAAPILTNAFREDTIRTVQAAILEAVGRCGTEKELKDLCSSRPYLLSDSILLEGQALGLYRFALRQMVHPDGTARIMNDFIANALMPQKARFVAANYLARVPNLDLSRYENVLINTVQEEKDPNTQMFLVLGLAKTKSLKALQVLKETFQKSNDYRVRCNIIRGMHHFQYDSTTVFVKEALKDTSVHVQLVAAEYFYSYGNPRDAFLYNDWSHEHPHWLVKTRLAAASLKHMEYFRSNSMAFISTKLTMRYKETENIYEKAAILQALGNFTWNYKFISEQLFPLADSGVQVKVHPIIASSAAEGLVLCYEHPEFELELGFSATRVRTELQAFFRRCIEMGDVGASAVVAGVIANPKLNFKQVYPDFSFIKTAQAKLSLPRDVETYIYLQQAIDLLTGTKTSIVDKVKHNFIEIDWPLVNALGKEALVELKTNKGKIVLKLLPQEAPATVMQFVQLVKAGFYNGKSFHRVVPNFVAQTGCPRGDGWGGFEVNVVSEFGKMRYTEAGLVGMASAGRDTESTQFFITHAPTIHLDGNYTIFAKVIEGMDIVHLLEIGDLIQTAELRR